MTAPPSPDAQRIDLRGETMGTNWSLAGYADPAAGIAPDDLFARIEQCFAELNALFSTWTDGSFISRFNAAAPGTQFSPEPRFAALLQLATEIADASDGAFNPCLGGEIAAAGFGSPLLRSGTGDAWPSARRHLLGATIVQPGGLQLDLSAIAKGAAVDQLGALAASAGVTSLLAEIGGEFVGIGVKPDGLPWWIDIETVAPSSGWRIAAYGVCIATSGDTHAVRVADGVRRSHIVCSAAPDPGLRSVTVLHQTCAEADAWATALFASGAAGPGLAERHNLAALFLNDGTPDRLSPAARAMLES